jgi:hypothetical protein
MSLQTQTTLTFDTLIARAAGTVDLTPDQVRAALTGALGLLDKHADRGPLSALYAALPGAELAAQSPEARPRGGGLFGGLMKSAGGVSGAAISDAMGALDRMKRIGVDKDGLKRLLPVAREQVTAATGRDLLGDAIRTVPGVGPMLGG